MTSPTDALLTAADTALRTLFAPPRAASTTPRPESSPGELRDADKRLSAALMRVNHVGEVCAQALYTAQALTTPNPALRTHFMRACAEETDHLAWTKQRLDELGHRRVLFRLRQVEVVDRDPSDDVAVVGDIEPPARHGIGLGRQGETPPRLRQFQRHEVRLLRDLLQAGPGRVGNAFPVCLRRLNRFLPRAPLDQGNLH